MNCYRIITPIYDFLTLVDLGTTPGCRVSLSERKRQNDNQERGFTMKKSTKRILIPCAAAALTIGASMLSYAAAGWQQEGGSWYYYTTDGDRASETWKKSGDHWFWVDSDGEMVTDSLIEYEDNYYYVNESGARVANEWRELDNTDDGDDAADTAWYYFSASGKAYKAGESGKTTFKSIGKADGTSRKYAFDREGRMLYGWVNEESERVPEEDAWRSGVYYLGETGDGALPVNAWKNLEIEDNDSEDEDFDGTYWFYFGSNGKKLSDTTKTINGRKYRFREGGNAEFNWYLKASDSTASESNIYYNEPDQCWQASGWFKTVPGKDVDAEAYENEDEYWFYALKSGDLVTSEIKKIGGYYYGFNEKGEMLQGLYKLSTDDKEIISYEKIEDEGDLPEAGEAWQVYYFADSPKEGAMKTGTATVELDGEKYSYNFRKSGTDRGAGYDEIHEDAIYVKGRLLKADKDAKLEAVTFEDEEYLINTSGKIQKNKTNAKDADDNYYCTDSKGVITYKGSQKWEK